MALLKHPRIFSKSEVAKWRCDPKTLSPIKSVIIFFPHYCNVDFSTKIVRVSSLVSALNVPTSSRYIRQVFISTTDYVLYMPENQIHNIFINLWYCLSQNSSE